MSTETAQYAVSVTSWWFMLAMVIDVVSAVVGMCVSATVTNLQQKLEGLQTANTLMTEDLTIAKTNILQLQQENVNLRHEKETLLDEHQRQMQVDFSAN